MSSATPRPYPPPIGDMKELSYQIGLSPSTIRLYIRNGWLPPPYRVGNRKLWIMAEVMAHIARIGKMEDEGEKALPASAGMDEYEEAIARVAPQKKTDDRAA